MNLMITNQEVIDTPISKEAMNRQPGLGGLTDQQIAEIIALGSKGETYARICEQTGAPISLISTILMGADIKPLLIRRQLREKRIAEVAEVHQQKKAVRKTQISPRDQKIIELRTSWATLEEIGQQVGLTRERVRQILKKHNIADPADIRRQESLKKKEEMIELGQRIEQWVREHPGCTLPELAFALSLDQSQARVGVPGSCAHLIVNPEANRRFNVSPRRWTRVEVLDALRRAAMFEQPLSYVRYDELRTTHSINGPSAIRVLQIFGTWAKACSEAGVEHGRRIRATYPRRWSEDEMVDFVASFLQQSSTGSLAAYEQWAKQNDAPSGPTIRLQFGSWPEAKTRANLLLRTLWTDH